jgi:hypothetical protein
MTLVYISLMVYYWNTIDGQLTKFIPHVYDSKLTMTMAISATHVEILIINRESLPISQEEYLPTLTVDCGL